MNVYAIGAAIVAALTVGFAAGLWARPFLSHLKFLKTIERHEVSGYMNALTLAEGFEERRNQLRRMVHDSGRRTMRLDAGPPATVHKMRRSKRKTIRPD